MARYKIEIEISDIVINECLELEPENAGEIIKELFMIECDTQTNLLFGTKKGNFKSKGQIKNILNKIKD